jgi:hypothetical protein
MPIYNNDLSAGVSTVGNTGGTTGMVHDHVVFVGSNNITLSQSVNGNSATISMFGGAGAAGNTGYLSAGTATASLGTIVFSNSNGVSFGVNGQTVTASAAGVADGFNRLAAGTQTAGTLATVNFANGNGITFGMSDSSQITASHNGLTSQSNQAVSGANGSFTFQTLSLANSNGVSFSTGTQGIYATVATNYQSQGAYLTTARASNDAVGLNTAQTNVTWTVNSNGISIDAGGYLTTAAQSNHSHGNPTLALTNLSGTTASASNGLTLSLSAAAAGGANNISYWDNAEAAGDTGPLSFMNIQHGTIQLFPLARAGFPGNMTVSTAMMDLSFSGSSQSYSVAHSSYFNLGIYVATDGTKLSLTNSCSTVQSMTAATDNSSVWNGQRWLTFGTGQWSTSPEFSANGEYYAGVLIVTSGNSRPQSTRILGQFLYSTAVRSGILGESRVTGDTKGFYPFLGEYSATSTGFPATIGWSEIVKSGASVNFVPHIVFNNITKDL